MFNFALGCSQVRCLCQYDYTLEAYSRKGGYEALYRGLSETYSAILMGRPKKKKLEEMTELERALYENERLRAEECPAKKAKAIIKEREPQLRNIGRKPSKN